MSVVDDRGRLFGRFNLIDATGVLLLIVLVPLGYAAYRLFRPAPMRILSVEPSSVYQGQQPRIQLHGENLRPFLRAQVGVEQAHTILIATPKDGEMVMPDLGSGTYDVTLYDEVQEVARLKNAITVLPPPMGPRVRLQVVGDFFGLDQTAAHLITTGRRFPNDASAAIETLEVHAPVEDMRRVRRAKDSAAMIAVPVAGSWRVPAVLRVTCAAAADGQACHVNETDIAPGVTLSVPGGLLFVIDTLRPDAPLIQLDAVLELVGRPDVLSLVAAGDVDLGGARILSIRKQETVEGDLSRQLSSGDVIETLRTPARVSRTTVAVRLNGFQTPSGVGYGTGVVKPGAPFTFETARYVVHGSVVQVAEAPGGTR